MEHKPFTAIRFIFSAGTTCLKSVLLQSEANEPRYLSIAIPASIASDTPHLREKTAKLGAVARASSIFGVSEILLYLDDPHHDQQTDVEFCSGILQYLETPQYLRKRIFKLNPTFKFTGILPPLQVPHHKVPPTLAGVRIGDIREGLVFARSGKGGLVDAGLEKTVSVAETRAVGERVTIRLVSVGKELRGEVVERSRVRAYGPDKRPIYWGYRVRKVTTLSKLLTDTPWDLKVGTSRYGTSAQEILTPVSKDLRNAKSTVVAFGSPKMGLREILALENLVPKDVFNYFVNTAPDQQTLTVRTEEAILISLSFLNLAQKLLQ